jgi:hypothetical protein
LRGGKGGIGRSERDTAISACFRLEYAEPVDPAECRDFVAFGQGRVIEYRIDEVVDLFTERQHRLTDMDQLAPPFVNDVDAERLAGLASSFTAAYLKQGCLLTGSHP